MRKDIGMIVFIVIAITLLILYLITAIGLYNECGKQMRIIERQIEEETRKGERNANRM